MPIEWASFFKECYARVNDFYLKTPAFWNPGENLARYNWICLPISDAIIAYERIDPIEPSKSYLVIHNLMNKQFEHFLIHSQEEQAIRVIQTAHIVFSLTREQSQLEDVYLFPSGDKQEIVIPELPAYDTVVIEQTRQPG